MMGCSYKESAAINLIIALGTVLALDFSVALLSWLYRNKGFPGDISVFSQGISSFDFSF